MAKSNLKKNDELVLDIEDVTNLGFGVGKKDGAVIFVARAVKGDRVRVKIIKAASSYYVGRVSEYLTLSPLRDGERCKNELCRSCAYRELKYSAELDIKTETVRAAFVKEGLSAVNVLPCVPSPRGEAYRNKAQYPVTTDKCGNYVIGFYAPKTHTVCEAADCPIAPPIFSEILDEVRKFLTRHRISTYREESGEGLLRHVYLRRSEELSEVLVTFVINGRDIPHRDELVKVLTSRFPEICGILINVNCLDTNVVLGDEFITLWGKDHITDTLAGVKLKITAPSFYQVNHGSATYIYGEARRLAALESSDTLLDLFCGAGSIGLSMARDCRELIGIEIVDSAVECARYNARENGIENASFYTGDASDAEKLLAKAEAERGAPIMPDVVVLDPPRQGSSAELLAFIAKKAPKRIVYISCNPTTLARDVKILIELGYMPGDVLPVDMFPMAGHVESVVCLKRQIQQ